MNDVPIVPIDLKRAIMRYKDYTCMVFREEQIFHYMVDVCIAYESGKLTHESPEHEVGKKKKIIKNTSII